MTEKDFKIAKSLKRALEDAFNDLEQQIRMNGRQTIMSVTHSSAVDAASSIQADPNDIILECISAGVDNFRE